MRPGPASGGHYDAPRGAYQLDQPRQSRKTHQGLWYEEQPAAASITASNWKAGRMDTYHPVGGPRWRAVSRNGTWDQGTMNKDPSIQGTDDQERIHDPRSGKQSVKERLGIER
ncbi:hypothetical protein PG991_009349 [Apiospora marii]|uniref:Uncharacterized protein n=1 Tax=Apiospora marii TaxID=335849 RepID=A0ABR1RKF7_9PEZI